MSAYGSAMSLVMAYAAIALAALLTSVFALRKLAWPDRWTQRLLVASAIALTWPLALPMASFGSAGLVQLIARRREQAAEVPVAVSPAA